MPESPPTCSAETLRPIPTRPETTGIELEAVTDGRPVRAGPVVDDGITPGDLERHHVASRGMDSRKSLHIYSNVLIFLLKPPSLS